MILNLTQHAATEAQREAGLVDLFDEQIKEVKSLLTFENAPSVSEMKQRAWQITNIASVSAKCGVGGTAMIGGAPFFMSVLEKALMNAGIKPVYAFSKRQVVEVKVGDEVKKTAIFKHCGFVEVDANF